MNFLHACLGSSPSAGDLSKSAKPVRITGPATPRPNPFCRTPGQAGATRSPPSSHSASFTCNIDPSKGAKPVRITGPAIPVSRSRSPSPYRRDPIGKPISSSARRSPRARNRCVTLSPVISSGRSSPRGLRTGSPFGCNRSPPSPRGEASPLRRPAISSSPGSGSPAKTRNLRAGARDSAGCKTFLSSPRSAASSPGRRRSVSPSSPRTRSPCRRRLGDCRRSPSPSPRPGSGSPTARDSMRRPSEVGTTVAATVGSQGENSDPFACVHLTELIPLTPLESTYRSHVWGTLPDGIEAPQASDQNMRRLYVHDEDRVLLKVVHYGNATSVGIEFEENGEWQFKPMWAQRAGPRALIYFNPPDVKAAIVTCGGLCPGLNDVIRQVVFTLELYGVKEILGIQYGFKGFVDPKYPPVTLTRKSVSRVHMAGGSFLGVSRGTPDLNDIVDRLQDWNISFFFVIGGNGSHAGAHAIYLKCLERKLRIAIVGIPKTIDNDLNLVDKTFGFDTSVEEAQRAINAGFVEASSAYNGVAIVKLMGRQSGFIAMYATLASGQVDIVLIPEVPFVLEGENGVYDFMKKRLDKYGLCVVVIAEGAGQELLESSGGVDASGNPILGDIGKWFQTQVKTHFGKIKMSVDVKYIDPTYMIRARPCNSSDHIFCSVLGQNAVHAAFGGYTDVTIGLVNTHYVFLPIPKVIEYARVVDPNSNMWHRTVTATGQPDFPPLKKQVYGRERSSISIPTSSRRDSKSNPSTPQSPSPGGDFAQTITPTGARHRLSEFSIKIDKNNVQIRSIDNYKQKRVQ